MKNFLEKLILGLAGGFLRLIPRRAALFIGRFLGSMGFYFAAKRRRTALMNLDIAFGQDKTRKQKSRIARKSFEYLGRNAIEFFLTPFLEKEVIDGMVSFSGEHNLTAALKEGRGAFLLSAHLGNWELFGVAMAMRGYPLAVITKISKSEAVNRIWMGYREDAGIRILKGRGLLKDTMRYLQSGGIVGFVLDQNARRSEGVFVPFFGREACTLKSLAVIDQAIRNDMSNDLDADILRWTENYTTWTERVIRLHPEQWTWLHDRWKTRPRKSPESRV
jgi:KDO2-lipid IV(A) lauroyltransferase